MIKKTKTGIIAGLLFFSILHLSHSQSVLDQYLEEGLANNLVLKEKYIALDQSLLALQNAKSLFLPSVDFLTDYTLAKGGRVIDLPLGDLLNGVYSSLNALTDSQNFPQLDNVREQFLPNNFYDTRFRISYPVFNADLHYNKQIRQQEVRLEEYELDIYRAELVLQIRQAYYNYCMAYTALEILQNSKNLVLQNLKDNQSLLQNGKGLPSQILRAESEVENIQAQIIEGENDLQNASYYVNFLLNRPLDQELVFEEIKPEETEVIPLLQENYIGKRPELMKIQTAEQIQKTVLKSNQAFASPKINSFLDLGSQGFDFTVNRQSQYYLFGLQLAMPIFHGNRNRTQIAHTKNNLKAMDYQKKQVAEQLSMAVKIAKNNAQSSLASKRSAEIKLEASKAYFRLVNKGYKEGTYSLIEFMDARNQYTNAALQVNLSGYRFLQDIARLERELASSIQ